MKSKNIKIILALLITSLLFCIFQQGVNLKDQDNLDFLKTNQTAVDRVVIYNNDDWNTLATMEDWCSGSGTLNNPYIIENIEIDAAISPYDYCMMISDTDVYFIIRNSIFKNGYAPFPQVSLATNVSNGQILNNIFSDCTHYGVSIAGNNNLIKGNNIDNNTWGMGVHGLYNTVTENTITNSEYIAMAINDNYTTVTENNIMNDDVNQGILIYGNHNYIARNTFTNPDGSGVSIFTDCLNNTITRNLFQQNYVGVEAASGTAENKIYENCFKQNEISASDATLDNDWDRGLRGNYWDDYSGSDSNNDGIGDTPYEIFGPANNTDDFPLMKCPLDEKPFPWLIIIIISGIAAPLVILAVVIFIIKRRK